MSAILGRWNLDIFSYEWLVGSRVEELVWGPPSARAQAFLFASQDEAWEAVRRLGVKGALPVNVSREELEGRGEKKETGLTGLKGLTAEASERAAGKVERSPAKGAKKGRLPFMRKNRRREPADWKRVFETRILPHLKGAASSVEPSECFEATERRLGEHE